MAAMALVFVGLMFIGGDVQGGSMAGLFKKTYVSVDGKSYGEKDYANMGAQALNVAGRIFPESFGVLTGEYFYNNRIHLPEELEIVNSVYSALKTNNPNAAFLAYRGIIRREAERLGLTPNREEVDAAIQRMPELCTEGKFDAKKYDDFITMNGPVGKKNQEELLRGLMEDTISLVRISEVLTGEIAVDPDFAKAVAESASQKITVNTAFLNKLLFKPKSDPGEAEIKSYWEKFKNNYKNEEARFVTVYTFIPNGDTTPGADDKLSNATLETLTLVEDVLMPALENVNAKNIDKVIADTLAADPGVCKLEKKHYTRIILSKPVEELQLPINKKSSDGSGDTLMEVAFKTTQAPELAMDADEKAIEAARAKTGMTQLSSTQVLKNGSVALVRVDGITPIKPLPFEEAREAACADLIATMTVEELNKAATDLKAELEKSATPLEQFNEIAAKYGASVTAYGPFTNAEPPKELPAPTKVFGNAALINPGKVAELIDTGDGLLVVQLVKREVEDTPQFGMLSSQIAPATLANNAARMIRLDWLKGCINRYKVSIEPGLNQQN